MAVSLLKRTVPTLVYVYDLETYDIDYYRIKLDNQDLFTLIGRAYAIGYENFEIRISLLDGNRDDLLASVQNGQIIVNWDIVGKLPKDAWNVAI